MEYLSKIIDGIPVNYFFSSEMYGEYVAKYLNIENILVDEKRTMYPINATMIRNDIEAYKNFVNDDVYRIYNGINEKDKYIRNLQFIIVDDCPICCKLYKSDYLPATSQYAIAPQVIASNAAMIIAGIILLLSEFLLLSISANNFDTELFV